MHIRVFGACELDLRMHHLKVSNFTENEEEKKKKKKKRNNESKFQNFVNQAIYSSAQISMPNMKALAQILFETSCTQDFQILFSKGHNSEKGITQT